MNRDDTERERVDSFVRRTFGLWGSVRLHRACLGWDLLAAPFNVVLSPVYLLSRLVALALAAVGLRRACQWILRYPIFFHSALARAVEARIETELWAPQASPGAAMNARQKMLLRDYTGVRTSVAEIFTTLVVLALGFAIFRNATPGVISLTPLVSDYMAHSTAIAEFPMGQWAGRQWYSVFPPERSITYVVSIGFGLAVIASLVTTFAGLIADPIQTHLGIHRRRLLRLLAALEAHDDTRTHLAREHAMARLADLTDAGFSLVRFLRG